MPNPTRTDDYWIKAETSNYYPDTFQLALNAIDAAKAHLARLPRKAEAIAHIQKAIKYLSDVAQSLAYEMK